MSPVGLSVTIVSTDDGAGARSILAVLALHARYGDDVILARDADGADSTLALLAALLGRG